MKNHFIQGTIALAMIFMSACNSQQSEWNLVWEEEFDQSSLDTTTWSKIPRLPKNPEWRRFMTDDEACYDIQDGKLILRGIRNTNLEKDTAAYLTGGVYTKYKRAFFGGKLAIKAKLEGATGAWPAIWLKPFEEDKYPWPSGGEIDIMEHLNYDSIAYQTVHSNYTHHLNEKKNPPQGSFGKIDPAGYNVYAVEMYKDSLVFSINDVKTFTYPRIETEKEGQYPFVLPYYLMIDMQLGGAWVGSIDANDVPVEMKVDWVRYYQKK